MYMHACMYVNVKPSVMSFVNVVWFYLKMAVWSLGNVRKKERRKENKKQTY